MKDRQFFIALLLAGLLVLGQFQGIVFAEESLEQKLERLQNEAYEQQLKTEKAQEKVDTVSEQLRRIQADVDEAENEYRRVQKDLDETDKKILENKALLVATEQKLASKNKFLRRRIREIYIHGRLNFVDVLFGAKSFSDFMTRMDLFKRIIKYDFDLIQQVIKDRAVIVAANNELEKSRIKQEELVAEADKQLAVLMTKKADKDRLLEKVVYDRDTAEQFYQELLAASQEVEMLIRQKTTGEGPRPSGTGSMTWPIYGEITSDFGWREHPIYGDSRFHSGLDISGDYGEPVCAAADGVCIYSDWISGYGYAIILDHGGGVSTLYGHNEELVVDEGQYVKRGDIIALCGSTGNSTGPHCHFEVREDGEPVSPYSYLP